MNGKQKTQSLHVLSEYITSKKCFITIGILFAIRQMVKGLWDWIWLGSSALESVKRWRLSAIKVKLELELNIWFSVEIFLVKNEVVADKWGSSLFIFNKHQTWSNLKKSVISGILVSMWYFLRLQKTVQCIDGYS